MNEINRSLIQLLKAYICGLPYKFPMEICGEMLQLSREQGVAGIVMHMARRYGSFDASDKERCHMAELTAVQRALQQKYYVNLIGERFEQEQVPFMPVKGIVINQVYPIPELREQGDIDIVILPKDKEKAGKIMGIMQFCKINEQKSGSDTDHYWNNKIKIEYHFCMFPSVILKGNRNCKTFLEEGIWTKATAVKGGMRYNLAVEDEFILMILHMASHFYSKNCGIRFFMDAATYLNYYHGQLNYKYIQRQIELLGYTEFFEYMMYLVTRWFGISVSLPHKTMSDEMLHFVENLVMSHGCFGEENTDFRRIKAKQIYKRDRRRGIPTRGKLILEVIFPDKEQMAKLYPYLKKRVYFYPIAWGGNMIRMIKDARKDSSNLKLIAKNLNDVRSEIAVMKQIGL